MIVFIIFLIDIFDPCRKTICESKRSSKTSLKLYFFKLSQSEKANIKVNILNNDFRHWKGYIEGPQGTPYEGGLFQVDIVLPPEYPYKPPKMKFDTKIWHPNISSQTGAICLDILKD